MFDSGKFTGKIRGGWPFAGVAFLLALSLEPSLAASARNPYPPVKDNGTVGDAAGTDTAAYLNDGRRHEAPQGLNQPGDRTGRGSPASGTNTPIPPPDVPGTPPGPQNGPQTGSRDGATGTGNSDGTGSGAGGTGGPGVGPGSGSGSGSGSGGSGSGGSGSGGGSGGSGGSGGASGGGG